MPRLCAFCKGGYNAADTTFVLLHKPRWVCVRGDGDLVNTDWPPYADPSGGVPDDDGTAQGTAFWWVLSNYGPAGSGACDCEDPDPYGTVWENTSGSTLTPTFWVAESGNTTSNCAGLVRDLN
jgi:hypothetical protein